MKKYLILLAKLILFSILTVVFMLAISALLSVAGVVSVEDATKRAVILMEGVLFVSVLLAAWIIIRFWDRLSFVDDMGFGFQYKGKDLLMGFCLAAIIYAIGFGVSLLAGWISVEGVHFDATALMLQFLLMVMVALAEESSVRGFVLGHMLDVGMNKYLALVLSSVIFASLHLGNPGMTNFSFFNLVLAGILLGAVYIFTRNLWFSISLHLFWNFIQGPILGYEVSGTSGSGNLLKLSLSDNTLMNGGNFGFEASLPCTILMLIAIGFIIYEFEKRRKDEKTVMDLSAHNGLSDNDGTGTAVG